DARAAAPLAFPPASARVGPLPPEGRPRRVARWTELRLLVAPCAFALVGLGLLAFSQHEPVDLLSLAPALVFVALVLRSHAGLAATGSRGDQMLFPLAAALSAAGLVTVHRVGSADLALRQTIWMLLGLGLLAGTLYVLRDPPALRRYKYTWALLGLVLL